MLVVGSNESDDGASPDPLHTVPGLSPLATSGPVNGLTGNDILVGDPGGTAIAAGDNANIVLVLDRSGSMDNNISFGGGSITRLQAMKNAVNSLIDSLSGSGANAVTIHIVAFDDNASAGSTFTLVSGGASNAAQVTAAHNFINGISSGDGTNYEAGLQRAIDWINGTSANDPIANATVNRLLFVSDGEPNQAYSGNGTSTVIDVTAGESIQHITGTGDGDSVSEITRIETAGDGPGGVDQAFTIEAVGISVNGTALNVLNQVEGAGGSANNITSAEQLTAVMGNLVSNSTVPTVAGSDIISGNAGNDVIFGDVLFTDTLADSHGLTNSTTTPNGAGWLVFQQLEAHLSTLPAYQNWTRADTLNYIQAHQAELAQESGRTGGNDTINGGAGDDVIYAQEGNDTITYNVGDGRDFVDGGSEPVGGGDTLIVNGDGNTQNFFLETVASYNTRIGPDYTGTAEALVSDGSGTIMVEMKEIESVTINGGGGADTLTVSGDFAGTSILNSTIKFNGEAGNDTLDLTDRADTRRVVADGGADVDTVKLGFAYNQATYAAIAGGVAITHGSVTDEFTNFENFTFETGSPVTLSLADLINDAPTDIALAGNSTAENSALGTVVGLLSTTDPEAWQTHTYAITGGTGLGKFTIVGNEIRVSGALDFETAQSYTLDISSTDNGIPQLSRTETFTINLTNVNEAPTLTATASNPTFAEAAGSVQAAAVTVFSGTSTSTIESGQNITSLKFTVSGLLDGASERIVVDNTSITLGANSSGTTSTNAMGYTVTIVGDTATVVLTKAAGVSTSAINTLVNGISYQNTNINDPTDGNRVFTLTEIKDSGGGDDTGSLSIASTVNVNPTNDVPVVSGVTVDPSTGAISFTIADPDNSSFSLTSTTAGLAAAFGSPTNLAIGGNTLIVPTEQASQLSGTLQVNDGAAGGNANVINVYLGTSTGQSFDANNASSNVIYGFGGNDTLTGGTAVDYIFGGTGNDTINLANGDFAAGEVINGGTHTTGDTIVLGSATTVNFTTGTVTGVETLTGSSSADSVTMSAAQWAGFSTINLASDSGGSDVLNVMISGAVDISAGNAASTTNVEDMNVTGGAGADTLTLTGDQLTAMINGGATIDLLGNTDTINITTTSSGLNGLTDGRLVNVEAIAAAATAAAGVTISVSSQSEAFTLTGSGFGDKLVGGSGADTINGGAGADTLTGNVGNDNLTGGSGADQFRLRTDGGTDTFTDFVAGSDKIGFFEGAATGAVNFGVTGTSAGASLTAGDGNFTVRSSIANINSTDDNQVVVINAAGGQTQTQILNGDPSVDAENLYVVVYNSTNSRAEVWFDTNWNSAGTGSRSLVAVLEDVTAAQVAAMTASDFVVYSSATDPIVLDLGQQGVQLAGVDQGVSFDINGDGAKDQVAWTAHGQDGILALDVDGSGKIENGNELFTTTFAGGHFADGIAALASLDSNHDGIISSDDQAFDKLVVWQDANHNGVSDQGELSKLSDLGIKSIDLAATASTDTINGQAVDAHGSFTYTNGSKGSFVEVNFDTIEGTKPTTAAGNSSTPATDHTSADHHDPAAGGIPQEAAASILADFQHSENHIDLSALGQPADHQGSTAPAGGGEFAAVGACAPVPPAIQIALEQAAMAAQHAA
nr:VWA domain-containing protein [Bradyrhizobium lablabi]